MSKLPVRELSARSLSDVCLTGYSSNESGLIGCLVGIWSAVPRDWLCEREDGHEEMVELYGVASH